MTAGAVTAVAVGASAGGPEALMRLLRELGPGFGPPVFLVQHLHRHTGGQLVARVRRETGKRAVEVVDHQPILFGTLHVAPANYHMLVGSPDTLVLSLDEPVHHSRPSVDVLFESAAMVFGEHLAGVVLTGASGDGAGGLLAIREAGGTCLVQEPDSAEVAAMPLAALSAVPDAAALPIDEIASRLLELAATAPLGRARPAAGNES